MEHGLSATTRRRSTPIASPVFGFTSNRGKFELDTSSVPRHEQVACWIERHLHRLARLDLGPPPAVNSIARLRYRNGRERAERVSDRAPCRRSR